MRPVETWGQTEVFLKDAVCEVLTAKMLESYDEVVVKTIELNLSVLVIVAEEIEVPTKEAEAKMWRQV